jgi:signal transduction histidine kinase
VLRIPYRQLDFVELLLLLDERGAPVAPAVYERGGTPGKPLQLDARDVDAFARRVPLALALETGAAIGAPYAASATAEAAAPGTAPLGPTRLPVALRLSGTRVLAAAFSLAALQRRVEEISRDGVVAFVATEGGVPLAHAGRGAALSPDELALLKAPGTRLVRRSDGADWLAAAAPVGGLGWFVVVLQRTDVAFRAADLVRLYTLFWGVVALGLIALAGALLSRRVSEPIQRLREGVRALAEGRSATPVEIDSQQEFGELAQAFNQMASEIRRWNAELQARVDERTAELKAAQDQIARTRRLAALGSLGAGVAHELNNPLTAIAGLVALARGDLEGTPHAETLRLVQEQTRRVSKIVADLRVFAESERSSAGRRFALDGPIRFALEQHGDELRARNIVLSTDVRPGLREAQGDPAQIGQVVSHLVRNAIQAMPAGGELRIALTDVAGDALKLTVSDTGKGIPAVLHARIFDPFFTTKSEPGQVGLGLSLAHSIVEAHHGKLFVYSAEGRGATFTIVLPAAALAAHLS